MHLPGVFVTISTFLALVMAAPVPVPQDNPDSVRITSVSTPGGDSADSVRIT